MHFLWFNFLSYAGLSNKLFRVDNYFYKLYVAQMPRVFPVNFFI